MPCQLRGSAVKLELISMDKIEADTMPYIVKKKFDLKKKLCSERKPYPLKNSTMAYNAYPYTPVIEADTFDTDGQLSCPGDYICPVSMDVCDLAGFLDEDDASYEYYRLNGLEPFVNVNAYSVSFHRIPFVPRKDNKQVRWFDLYLAQIHAEDAYTSGETDEE
jgi:hypothetical protein